MLPGLLAAGTCENNVRQTELTEIPAAPGGPAGPRSP